MRYQHDRVTGEMIRNGDENVINWVRRLCNKEFVEGILSKNWSKAVSLYKGKKEKENCRNYKGREVK